MTTQLQSTDPALLQAFQELLHAIQRVRKECPWDAKLTFHSLAQYSTEEVFELQQAILDNQPDSIKKELGDLLMHLLFYALIAEENQLFNLKDICDALTQKLIYRHPHVFNPPDKPLSPEEVATQWEELKLKEKGGNNRILQGVPKALPPLTKALRIQEKAAAVGFDWEKPADVWPKVDEELQEVKEALMQNDSAHTEEEFGDLLFAIVNAARLHGVDPALALERSNRKFTQRFNALEENILAQGKQLAKTPLEELEAIYQQIKKAEKGEAC